MFYIHVCVVVLLESLTDYFLSSLALHPDKTMVATAQTGKAPFICVWDCVTMETVSILQGGHERGIAALGFSGNGNVSWHGAVLVQCLQYMSDVYMCLFVFPSSLLSPPPSAPNTSLRPHHLCPHFSHHLPCLTTSLLSPPPFSHHLPSLFSHSAAGVSGYGQLPLSECVGLEEGQSGSLH